MTATMDNHTELIKLQNEMRKVIRCYSMLKLKDSPTESTHKRLKYYEDLIQQLDVRQKKVLTCLRTERFDASALNQALPKSFYVHNQTNLLKSTKGAYADKQPLSLKPPFNGKKLLVPVSAAAATSKKINQQILVVSTPGGGARLATTTSPNANRPALGKSPLVNSNGYSTSSAGSSLLHPSSNKSKQYNNFTITNTTKAITTPLSNSLSLTNSRIIANDKTVTAASNSLLPSTGNAVKRKLQSAPATGRSSAGQALPPISKIELPKVDEAKLKEQFMLKLGLVTKQALNEIQNKKSERKRRTTANPQFSTAAITAKRIEAQENAAKKAIKKREREGNLLNSNNPPNKRTFLSNTRGNKAVNSGKPERKAPKGATGKQLSQNSNEIKISRNCFVCDEVCDSDLDEIMFCGDCHCLFHVTCSETADRIMESKTMGVPCPKCERKRSLRTEELPFNENSNESADTLKQKAALDSSASNSSSVVSGKALCRRKIDKSKNVKFSKTNKYTNPTSRSEPGKPGFKAPNESSKAEPKDDERFRCLVKYELLDRQVRDFRVKLALLKDKVYISKENRREMLIKKENSKRSIDLIVNLVKKIQEQEDIETKENQENQRELGNQIVAPSKEPAKDGQPTVESSIEPLGLGNCMSEVKVMTGSHLLPTSDPVPVVADKVTEFCVTEEEANEAANNLNALSEICSQISSGELITSSSSKAAMPLSEVASLNHQPQELSSSSNLVQEEQPTVVRMADELSAQVNDLNTPSNDLNAPANAPANPQSNEEERPPSSHEADEPVMVAEIELDSHARTDEPNDDQSGDEPPNKRARLSPVLECKAFPVAPVVDLDDEVSAAIASIQD